MAEVARGLHLQEPELERSESFAKYAKWGSLALMAAGALALSAMKFSGGGMPKLQMSLGSSDYSWKEALPETAPAGGTVRIAFLGPEGSEFQNVDVTGPNGFAVRQGILPGSQPRLFVWEWSTFGLEPGEYSIRVGGHLKSKLTLLK